MPNTVPDTCSRSAVPEAVFGDSAATDRLLSVEMVPDVVVARTRSRVLISWERGEDSSRENCRNPPFETVSIQRLQVVIQFP